MNKTNVICLMGPTASGKSSLAVELTKQFPIELISVDSALVYKGMDIGTAKPDAETLKNIPHRLINICEPNQAYSAGQFRDDAIREIEDILSHQKIPLLVGGTMLYFNALQKGLADLPQADEAVRKKINDEIKQQGLDAAYQRLKEIDPESAKQIKPTDPQRIQRALELYEITGKTRTELWQSQQQKKSPYNFINIAIAPKDRSILHQRIEKRFHEMLKNGFIEEVKHLKEQGTLNPDMPSMRAVGYRQIWQYLDDELTKEEMIEKAIVATRQLAKRQLTWLRGWENINWFDSEDAELLNKIIVRLKSN